MHLYRGEAAFQEYVKAHPDKFLSALNNIFQTCCHPEFLLNKMFRNEHTEWYAKLWDEIYSEIQSFLGNHDECTKANSIVMKVEGYVLSELLKRAVEAKHACTSEQLRESWQHPEFIKAHSKCTSEGLRELAAIGDHPWQHPGFI
jgi:hypothetical protein